ncbi:thioredoxin domain-containing protein [uncultured Microbacterium sp.]|uniref:DsbA family protein n=1 Tax=uncultured Microbacterium sp. TaxID=191216 RepID=UPI0028D48140|nr:thioredoxin domain-containing protein [uncultured Microbacterium sp.]
MAAAKSNTNWFVIGVSAAVVVVLAVLATVVVVLNNQATAPGVAPDSEIVNQETGAISFGDGDQTIDTYIDFMCPICGQFEDAYGEQLQAAAADGTITLNIHPISILDRASQNTQFSTRAANSMYCVATEAPDAALDYFNLLFANQPEENTAGLSDDQLIELATQAGADSAADCITDGTYSRFVANRTTETPVDPATGNFGTPTVAINGDRIDNSEIATEFAKILG